MEKMDPTMSEKYAKLTFQIDLKYQDRRYNSRKQLLDNLINFNERYYVTVLTLTSRTLYDLVKALKDASE